MKNLRGSILTLLATIVVASVANPATAQLPPPGLAGSMPLPNPGGMPMFANAPLGPGVPQGAMMPPPQAMAQFANGAVPGQTIAQYPAPQAMYNMPAMGGYGPAAYGPGAAMQPNWVQPASYAPPQPFPGAGGMSAPAGYEMGGGYGDYGGDYGGGGCASCGGDGCGTCSGRRASGIAGQLVARLLPYGEGGKCAPRWYDITLDGMYLTRENAGRSVDFSSDGILGDIILSSSDLDFEEQLGFRFNAAHQIFAGATAEFTYFGLFNWTAAAATPESTLGGGDIFSVLSDFGTDPFDGFDETDRAFQHSISYSSTIDNFELNVRKRFTAPNCRLQFSWLAGVRYLYLLEDFEYRTIGGDADLVTPGLQSRGSMDYDVRARNSLTGFQLGGDAWLNLVPGVNVGADIKAGVYGNYANQSTSIVATTTAPANTTTLTEDVDGNDVALVADANLYFMWRLDPHWTLRAGYSFLFLDGVVLGPENFNAEPPNILTGGAARAATINDNGNIFYHGGFAGLEWMW